ncbi:MAG TPA: class I SAM-dependent rRNA methyltransferase [Polyangiales bacterium]|nr:class I SAM-dependent rRNA methyltransferase [Polyangiales bacterium]
MAHSIATVTLQRSHAGPVAAGHPWVFAQAVQRVEGSPSAGDEVCVSDPTGRELGRGFWSPDSAIVVRLLTRDAERVLDEAFFAARVADAIALRKLVLLPREDTTGYRLLHAEGDGLPGLIVDVYGDVLVVQLLSEGMLRRKELIASVLRAALNPRSIVLAASGAGAKRVEGAPTESTLLHGEAVTELRCLERGLRIELPAGMQKTGYYFDQREQRAEVERLAAGREVLDACSYVGGFALSAARGGAKSVLALDSSPPAIAAGTALAAAHGFGQVEFRRADVRDELARQVQDKRQYELTIFDPPKFVPTVKHLERGRRAYRQLNAHAIRLTAPGGLLVTCSCSAALTEIDFLRMLSFAAGDARRELRVLRVMKQGPDHPLLPAFAEGAYLKTAIAIVH